MSALTLTCTTPADVVAAIEAGLKRVPVYITGAGTNLRGLLTAIKHGMIR